MSRLHFACFLSVSLAGLSGCAQAPEPRRATRLAPACEEIAGEATMASRARARRAASVNLFHRIDDNRNFFAANGLAHVSETGRRTNCAPYGLWPELSRCVVTARVCGRA